MWSVENARTLLHDDARRYLIFLSLQGCILGGRLTVCGDDAGEEVVVVVGDEAQDRWGKGLFGDYSQQLLAVVLNEAVGKFIWFLWYWNVHVAIGLAPLVEVKVVSWLAVWDCFFLILLLLLMKKSPSLEPLTARPHEFVLDNDCLIIFFEFVEIARAVLHHLLYVGHSCRRSS